MIIHNPRLPAIDDLKKHPIWMDCGADGYCPVLILPVRKLTDCLVVCELRLANGDKHLGILSGIYLNNATLTNLTIDLIIIVNNEMFGYRKSLLEPYRSNDICNFLSLRIEEIFPISYDISRFAVGRPEVLKGQIEAGYPAGLSSKD